MDWINILLIGVIWVFIIDVSGVIEEAESFLTRQLRFKAHIPKPFSCSLCMTFWSGLVYLLFKGCFSWLLMSYVCLVALLTPVISDLMILLRETLRKLIQKLMRL